MAPCRRQRFLLPVLLAALLGGAWLHGLASAAGEETPAERGYRVLTEKAWLPTAFDQETFDAVWQSWPEPLRSEAAAVGPDARRRMAFSRYGLTTRPGDPTGKPLQYAVDGEGRWSMTCFACHAGKVAGDVIPGLPNSHLALQTLSEEIRDTKRLLKKPMAPADIALAFFPMGTTNGTTNAVMFSVSLLVLRDRDLNLVSPDEPPRFAHHDMDAPAWWNVRKRSHFYVDGFAPKGHRTLMQFTLVPQNGPAQFHAWEDDFRDVLAYLESLRPPKWPHAVDADLAAKGRTVFGRSCASCHGTYGETPTYSGKCVPLGLLGTDPARLAAITPAQRAQYAQSWFTRHDPAGVVEDPVGYVAPPLDGVWATAPYLHNGSVPTLWHVLHPDARPRVWRRTEDGYDRERVGLEVEELPALPEAARADAKVRRTYFDTSAHGKSAAGHRFPDVLSEEERRAVLEYLKTL